MKTIGGCGLGGVGVGLARHVPYVLFALPDKSPCGSDCIRDVPSALVRCSGS